MFVNITITNFICSIGVTYFVETEKKKTKKTFGKVVRVIPFHLSPLHKNKTKLQCCFIRIKGHQNFGGHINQKRKKEGSYIYKNFSLLGANSIVAAPGIFLKVFLKKHKLYNLIKREIHILTTTTIKKHANI